MSYRRAASVSIGALFACAMTSAQASFPPIPVNTVTASTQELPSVAMDSAGRFVVSWDALGSAPQFEYDVKAQRFDDLGASQGSELQVNTFSTGEQSRSDIASDSAGNFVVVWAAGDFPNANVFAQRFDSTGARLGSEFMVNTSTQGEQSNPRVARNPSGDFVVVWTSLGSGGFTDENVFARVFDAAGAETIAEFQVNIETSGYQERPDVAIDGAGNFVVVWESPDRDGNGNPVPGNSGIVGRRFPNGGAATAEFPVNAYTSDGQNNPRIAVLPSGQFVVVWESNKQDGDASGIFGRAFRSAGVAQTQTEFRVNTTTAAAQQLPDVAWVDGVSGSFIVVWRSGVGGAHGLGGIFGKTCDFLGCPLGSSGTGPQDVEFAATPAAQSQQLNHPRVAANISRGNVVVTWVGDDDPGTLGVQYSPGIFACRAETRAANGLTIDPQPAAPIQVRAPAAAANNRVLEPGETVSVEPTWTNTLTGTQVLSGTASGLTGPAGGTYSLDDATADYGSVAEGATANCQTATGDCFQMTVSGSPRPATHWDASFLETLNIGLAKPWTLHVGESFTDVPTSQLFYRAIESVLHSGITTGCTATTYCPEDQVTRAQMSLFLARGVAGGGAGIPASGAFAGNAYNCAAGGVSLFTDVLPTDIFCRSVHYLAVQNVTSGCSATQYCPTPNVTRLEMSAFVARAVVAPGGGAAVPLTYGPDPVTGFQYSCDQSNPNIHFDDVPSSNSFCKHAHFLWAKGIISGCGATAYCPNDPVTRDAMARFLTNGFQVQLYGP